MEDDDFHSEVSIGSVISLESLEDSAPVHEKNKSGKKKTRKDQSPYSSQRFSGGSFGKSRGKATGHEAWSAAIRNGYHGLSSEGTSSNRWAQPRMNTKKTKVPSGPFSRDEHILASGKPAYKSPEDYYDEIMELRQVIKELKSDNGVLKTKLQRITQENVLKDRQIKDFLNPNKQPDEIRRTLTDRNADSSAVVSSLKQKLHLMERNLKDKESELRKLKSDMKYTNNEELKIQVETYYQETQRLQNVLSSVYSQAPGTRMLPDSRAPSSRMSSKANSPRRTGLSETDQDRLEQILDDNRRLESENKALKKDLLSVMERPRREGKTSTNKTVDYADMNRIQMLRKIGELEQSLEDAQEKIKSNSKKDSKADETKGDRAELESELQKQRAIIENLKNDRTHYREEAEKLRLKLHAAHKEIEELREDVRQANERDLLKEKPSPPRPVPKQRTKTSSMKKSISFQTVNKEQMDRKKEEEQAAKTLQKHWRLYQNQKTTGQNKVFLEAVVQIQSILRGHVARRERIKLLSQAKQEADEDLDWDDAVTRIQSALRAHRSRLKYHPKTNTSRSRHRMHSTSDHSGYSSEEGDERKETTTPGRKSESQTNRPPSSPRRKTSVSRFLGKLVEKEKDKTKRRREDKGGEEEDEEDDDDDDVVIGGSRRNLNEREHSTARIREVRKQGSVYSVTPRKHSSGVYGHGSSTFRGMERDTSDSEDNVRLSARFKKTTSNTRNTSNTKDNNGLLLGVPSEKSTANKKKPTFFGRQQNSALDVDQKRDGVEKESSFDSIFASSRSTKTHVDHRAPSDEESDGGLVTTSKKSDKASAEDKTKKSPFSWGTSKEKKSDVVPSLRGKKSSASDKETSNPSKVLSSRPSETINDDEDDDVVVTPNITRRNPTKTASLLDELF